MTRCFEEVLISQGRMRAGEDQNALRFGTISQLRLVALEATKENTRRSACQALYAIATSHFRAEIWNSEEEIFSLPLRTLGELHIEGENRDLTEPALLQMASLDDESSKVWLFNY